jgi:hypothetical protein
MRWQKYIFNMGARLQDPASDGAAGGAGSPPPADPKPAPPPAEDVAALKARIAELEAKDKNLLDRTRDQNNQSADREREAKSLEAAVVFNVGATNFLKENADFLPKEVSEIFATAAKERFDTPVQKANEVKSGIVESFFSIQDNHDLLTPAQKNALADYLKLTKNGKQERAQQVYDNLFEPALEMLKRVKKAEQVNRTRNGFGDGTDEAYKKRLIEGSFKHYGVKNL